VSEHDDATLVAEVARRVHRRGPVPFAEVMDLALYDDDAGFYAGAGGRAGRRGDFLTSPEVGPLFGAVLGRALDAWWDELGRPDPFVVIEGGAGPGSLALAVLTAAPECAPALTWVLVERSAAQRGLHPQRLPVVEPFVALPPVVDGDALEPGTGPRVASLAELPAGRHTGVVLANELLDNLPFDVAERTADGWAEVLVGVAHDALLEVLVPLDDRRSQLLDDLLPDAPVGVRLPVQEQAGAWLRAAIDVLERGRVVVVDYTATSAMLADRGQGGWLRTYRAHGQGGSPLEAIGSQDITADVDVDQLARIRRPDLQRTQAAFLVAHGIEALVEEGRRIWSERAHLGDLAAVRARSRVGEAEALLEPTGLGGFGVLEWSVP